MYPTRIRLGAFMRAGGGIGDHAHPSERGQSGAAVITPSGTVLPWMIPDRIDIQLVQQATGALVGPQVSIQPRAAAAGF
jgi:hypothetical protein